MSTKNRELSRTERAAAIQREQERKERTKRGAIVAAVVVVVVVVIGIVFVATRSGGESSTLPGGLKVARDGSSMVVGNNADAKVKVVVYEDFLCPYCREFESSTRDFLHADAAKGKVLVTYRPIHFLQQDYSKNALDAFGQVLENGTGAQALKFHDLLYENQPYEDASSFPTASDLRDLAKKAGVSRSSVLDAIGTEDSGFYDAAQQAGSDAKVNQTPTVLVNGKDFGGARTIDGLASRLQKRIDQQ